MNFWKQILLTSLLFSAVAASFIYSSCEKDACNNVTCYHGGACGNGKCTCPTGYENAQCQDKSVTRFVGVFAGYTSCNGGARVIDTAFIYADTSSAKNVNYAWVTLKSDGRVLHGYTLTNESNYSIVVPADTATNYIKTYSISIQSASLSINTYEYNEVVPGDTIVNKCIFVGTKDK